MGKRTGVPFHGLLPFRETTYFRAFLLNSLAAALTVGLTLSINIAIQASQRKNGGSKLSTGAQAGIAIALAFGCSIVTYGILFVLFGYGGGNIVSLNLSDYHYALTHW